MNGCDAKGAAAIGAETSKAEAAQSRLVRASGAVGQWDGVQAGLDAFDTVKGTCTTANTIGSDWGVARDLYDTLRKASDDAAQLNQLELPTIPDPNRADKLKRGLETVGNLEQRIVQSADLVADLDIETERLRSELEATDTEVSILLGTRGVCPTCGVVCSASPTHLAAGGEA